MGTDKDTDRALVRSDVAHLVGEEPRQQSIEWVVDRVGWIMMAVVLTAALAGLWGNGPLSNEQAISADGQLSVSYDRFVRNQGSTEIELQVSPNAVLNGAVSIGIDSEFLMANQIQGITPTPSSVTVDDRYEVYRFDVAPRAGLRAKFDLRPDPDSLAASHTVQFRLAGSAPMQVRQFVYP